ncbi:hypothetical protein KJZ99_02140 [bacterium]|nr:hypothetical protein [bacterium]
MISSIDHSPLNSVQATVIQSEAIRDFQLNHDSAAGGTFRLIIRLEEIVVRKAQSTGNQAAGGSCGNSNPTLNLAECLGGNPNLPDNPRLGSSLGQRLP